MQAKALTKGCYDAVRIGSRVVNRLGFVADVVGKEEQVVYGNQLYLLKVRIGGGRARDNEMWTNAYNWEVSDHD